MDNVVGVMERVDFKPGAAPVPECRESWPPCAVGVLQTPEILRLFYAIQATNADSRPIVLQVLSSVQGEGTSTVASGLARVAAEHGASVLLLDAGYHADSRYPAVIEVSCSSGHIDNAVRSSFHQRLFLARLAGEPESLRSFAAADLFSLLQELKQQYSFVVLDCPPTTKSPDSLALSRCCDGTILVVRAEITRRAVVTAAKDAIERFGGHVIGLVLNRRHMYIPSWLYRFL